MLVFLLISAAIVPVLLVTMIYQSSLQAMIDGSVLRRVFNKGHIAHSKQEHDSQALHTRNHELLREVENLRAQVIATPVRLEVSESKLQDSIRRADGLQEQKGAVIEEQRQATESFMRSEQQMGEARAAQEQIRAQLKVDLDRSVLHSENLQRHLVEEQTRADGLQEKRRQASEALMHCEQQLGEARTAREVVEQSSGRSKVDLEPSKLCSENLQGKLREEQRQAEAQLEEARNVAHDHQPSRRDLLAEILFLQHYFGEAGEVARAHWQSYVCGDSSKEPFEREADLALSTHPDKWPLNGNSHDHLTARDGLVAKVG